MSAEQNKALIHRWVDEVINKLDLTPIDGLFTNDYVNHFAPPGTPPGPEGEKQITTMFFTAFPDGHFTIEDIFAEGDRVCIRYSYRGTHRGNFMGLQATGKQFTAAGVNVFRVAGGKIAENWVGFDTLGLLQQLGAVPAGV